MNAKDKLIIGLVGEKLSGKFTFSELLFTIGLQNDQEIVVEVFSQILKETLNTWNLPHTRANYQKLPEVMREAFGKTALADAVYNRVIQRKEKIIVLDGVRWETDRDLIRKFPNNILVYITAPAKIRYKRSIKRGQYERETLTSFQKFMEEEKAPAELFIPTIAKEADFKIVNDKSIESFLSEVEKFYNKAILPFLKG